MGSRQTSGKTTGFQELLAANLSVQSLEPRWFMSASYYLGMVGVGMRRLWIITCYIWMSKLSNEYRWEGHKKISGPGRMNALAYTPCDRPIECLWNKKPRRGLIAGGRQHTR